MTAPIGSERKLTYVGSGAEIEMPSVGFMAFVRKPRPLIGAFVFSATGRGYLSIVASNSRDVVLRKCRL